MSKSGAWIAPSYSPLPSQPRLRLICLPWAGGSSSIYTEWPGFLEQAGVEVLPVELPGRNARAEEEPYTDVRALAADLAAWLAVESSFLNVPFAIFGHSFGGLCAYELSRALAARQPPQPPALLLVSAAPAPRFAGLGSWPASSISQLSQQELEDYLAKKGSPLPRALCEDPELAAPFLRTIRADYSALEAYKEESPLALPCPIQVFGGLGDIDKDKLEAWWHCSAHGAVGVRMHEGGHFYIQSAAQREKVISHIAEAWDRIGDPEDATLSAVCKLARGVLALPEGEEVEDLARAGLDSLESIGLAAEIRAKLGVGLAPDEVIRRPLARHLARYIDIQLSSAGGGGPPELLPGSAEEAEWHPVSYQQEQMIVMYEVSKTAYNMPTTLHWRGPLDVEALRKALRILVKSQGTLRTVVRMGDSGQMQQRVLDEGEADRCFELRELTAATPEQAAKAIEEESVRVFDLERGPMFRASVIDGWSEGERYVLLNQHHLGADGWTRMETRRQLCSAYVTLSNGGSEAEALAPPSLTYLDFTYWQRRWLEQRGERERQLRYWRKQLSGQQVLDLPLEKPRPKVLGEKGFRRSVVFSRQQLDAIKACFDAAGCSLFQGFLTLYMAMLSRWSSCDDITVGVAMAGRQHTPELSRLVGYFANEVAIRTSFAEAPALSTMLARVKAAVMDGMANSGVPFHDVVSELNVQRDASRTPVFQAMFAYQERAWHTVEDIAFSTVGAEVDVKRFEHNTCKFEVHLQLRSDGAGGIEGDFYYHKDLFDEASGDRMVQHIYNLVTQAVAEPHRPLCSLEVVGEAEREILVRRWNDTCPADFPAPRYAEEHVWEVAEDPSLRHNVALLTADGCMTYAELAVAAKAAAAIIRQMVGGPGRVVGLMMKQSPELLTAMLAILHARCIYLPIDGAKTPTERIKFMLSDGAASMTIVDQAYSELATELTEHWVSWDTITSAPTADAGLALADCSPTAGAPQPPGGLLASLGLLFRAPPASAELGADARTLGRSAQDVEDTMCIFYTSGTTGLPKGVLTSHGNCHNLIAWWRRFFGVGPADRVLQFSSYSFVMSLRQIFPTLATGATLVIPSQAEAFGDACEQHRVTRLVLTPSALETLEGVPSALQAVQVAGEKPSLALAQRWSEALEERGGFFIGLGPTELTAHCCCGRFSPGDQVTIGMPAENVRVYIGNASAPLSATTDLKPLQPINVTGELLVAGANVAKGYLNQPGANKASFRADGYSGQGRMYCTGDLARRLPDGRVQFVGRADKQIKIRGFRIEVSEIVVAIQRNSSAKRVEVLLKDGVLVAYMTPEILDSERDALLTELGRWLPAYMIPAHIIGMSEFPLNKNGKVDAAKLPSPTPGMAARAAGYADGKAPSTTAEAAIHGVWCSMLGLEGGTVSVTDNFFRLGGTSLLAVVMSRKVNATLGCKLGVADVFNNQTLESLAKVACPDAKAVKSAGGPKGAASGSALAESMPPLVMLPPEGKPMNPCAFLFCQVLGLGLISALASAPMSALIAGTVHVAQGYGLVTAALVFPALAVGASLGFLLLILATKWLIMGRCKPGNHCIRGWAFLRWWLMRKVLSLPRALMWLADETPLVPLWYWLLGAKIGRGVSMENVEILEPDLVEIGDHCRLEYHTRLLTTEVVGDSLRFGSVTLGDRVSCGVRSVVLMGANLATGCRVDAKAHVFCHQTEPWSELEGCPAAKVASVTQVDRLVPRRTLRLFFLQALGAMLILLSMEVAFLTAIAVIVTLWVNVHAAVAVAFTAIFTSIVCSAVWLLEIVVLKWMLLGRVRPSDKPRAGTWFLARKWVIDRLLLSPAHHYAGMLVLQTSSTGPLYYRMLGARIGKRAWVNHMYIRAGIDTVTMGSHSHWGRDSCLFTDSVSAEGVTFKTSHFGDHVSVGQWVVCMPGVCLGSSVNVGAETSLREGLKAEDRYTVFGCPPLMFQTSKSDAEVVAQTQVAAVHLQQLSGDAEHTLEREGSDLQNLFSGIPDLEAGAPDGATGAATATGRMQDVGGGSHFYTYVVVALLLQTLGPFLMAVSFGGVWLLVTTLLLPEELQDSVLARVLLVPPVYLLGSICLILMLAAFAKAGLTDFRSGSETFFSFRFLLWHVFADVIYVCSSTVLYPFSGTAIYVFWLRLMGAKVGKNVFVSPEQGGYRELNFLEIGDDAVVLTANLHAHYTDHGMLQFAPVKIASNCRINVGATVLPLTNYETGSTLRPFTVAVKGQKCEAGCVYAGNPGVPVPDGTALLLPGQGTQYAGMLEHARAIPAVAAMLQEARELLKYDVADLDDAQLARGENAHVAVFLADLAAFERLRAERPDDLGRCTAVLGFSLGEIAALVVAEALPFSAALRLVHERGRAVDALCPAGAMCNVVGLRQSEVESLCAKCGCTVANVLVSYDDEASDNVLVCSGLADAVDQLTAAAREAGAAKAARLNVGYAYHSVALRPAMERFRQAVEAAPLALPKIAVYSNVTGQPYPPSVQEMRRLLVEQLVSPVEWHAALSHLNYGSRRPAAIYECGPKRELKAVMRRFDKELWARTVSYEVGESPVKGALPTF